MTDRQLGLFGADDVPITPATRSETLVCRPCGAQVHLSVTAADDVRNHANAVGWVFGPDDQPFCSDDCRSGKKKQRLETLRRWLHRRGKLSGRHRGG